MQPPRLIHGSARDLSMLEAESVQTCVTSPPYWGLRQYAGEQREVWGGDADCAHEWGAERLRTVQPQQDSLGGIGNKGTRGNDSWTAGAAMTTSQGAFCACGAWYGALGLEPTPELYVEHMVAVFREVRRVLRKDGTLWLNLGDSYAGSGPSGNLYQSETTKRRAANGGRDGNFVVSKRLLDEGLTYATKKPKAPPGLKPKDLVGIPWMVAFALRADGWYLRSDIIWHKPNPMPESVTDRPTKSHEYLFLLSKSQVYYYDQEAIREPVQSGSEAAVRALREGASSARSTEPLRGWQGTEGALQPDGQVQGISAALLPVGEGASQSRSGRTQAPLTNAGSEHAHSGRMDGDQGGIPESVRVLRPHDGEADDGSRASAFDGRAPRGEQHRPGVPLLQQSQGQEDSDGATSSAVAGRNRRTVWTIATRPYPGAHFATYPEDLVEPCILAGSAAKACGECGAPWERVTERSESAHEAESTTAYAVGTNAHRLALARQAARAKGGEYAQTVTTTTWQPTCAHQDDSGASVVLDPFNGSGTTGRVAVRHGRSYIGVDISEEYLTEQATKRIDRVQHEMGI